MEKFLERPDAIAELTRDELAALLARTKSLEGIILAKLLSGAPASADDSLNADELARALGVTRRHVFRHLSDYPFATRTGAKAITASRAGLSRWLKSRRS